RFWERQGALHPRVALGTGGPQRALAPLDPKASGASGAVIGRLDAVLSQKDPERVHRAPQAAGTPARRIGAVRILGQPFAAPRIPRSPLSTGGWGGRHGAEPWPFGERPRPTGGPRSLLTLRPASGRAGQGRQARLAAGGPPVV